MLTVRKIRAWYLVHKWTSLVCTAFLLMLCVTGLPLVFHEEIDGLLKPRARPAVMAPDTPKASLDAVVAVAKRVRPGEFPRFVFWDDDDPNVVFVSLVPRLDAPPDAGKFVQLDARTAEVLGQPEFNKGLTAFLLKLHTEMFLGLPGELFLGGMGLLFLAAIVSGVVLYGPFMRKLDFGTVRRTRSRRIRWLDLHNLLGIVTVAWLVVVGATGVVNTLALPILQAWRADALGGMIAAYKDKAPVAQLGSVDQAVANARALAPGMVPDFIAYPGSLFSTAHHYAVFLHGATPLTERLLKPVLIDAETGAVSASRNMPWYVTTLLVSQPLHFGDYGGLPLKIVWALLDVITIVVLGSGLYLWLKRRSSPLEARLAALADETADARLSHAPPRAAE
jgi:uncharacterized iron-regulated membrane protein